MAKLCQIIAIVNGRKSETQSKITEIHHRVTKEALCVGMARSYTPVDLENGEKLPPENKRVQQVAKSGLAEAAKVWTSLFDVVATQDQANCRAKADIVVDGKVVLSDVPVTHLLFLEKQLTDVKTFIDKMPVLDPTFDWTFDANRGFHVTAPVEQIKTTKLEVPLVLSEATDKHPAQVKTINKDVLVGTWSTTHFSGAIPATERQGLLERVTKLLEAVKSAQQVGNQIEVTNVAEGKEIFDFILGN